MVLSWFKENLDPSHQSEEEQSVEVDEYLGLSITLPWLLPAGNAPGFSFEEIS